MNALTLSRRVLIFALIGFVYNFTTWLFPLVLPESTVARLVREDSIIEYVACTGFLVAGVLFLIAWLKSRTGNNVFGILKTRRNYIFLALALVFLFGAGEEISWGQRILGYDTPDLLAENEQEEFTLHNLPLFDTSNIGNLFQMNRLFLFFWFGLCIMLPISSIISQQLRKWYATLGVPIVPLVLGGQFLLNYILSKLYWPLDVIRDSYDGRITEIRESQEALVFALIAGVFLLYTLELAQKNSQIKIPDADAALAETPAS